MIYFWVLVSWSIYLYNWARVILKKEKVHFKPWTRRRSAKQTLKSKSRSIAPWTMQSRSKSNLDMVWYIKTLTWQGFVWFAGQAAAMLTTARTGPAHHTLFSLLFLQNVSKNARHDVSNPAPHRQCTSALTIQENIRFVIVYSFILFLITIIFLC